MKADGKEPPAALGVVQSSPTGKNPHDRVLHTPRQEENGRHSRWPGAASSSLVSRSRAAGRRPAPFSRWGLQAVPAVAPLAIRHLICWGYVPRREPSRGDWGLRRRGPAGRCAGRRPAFQAVPANCAIGSTRSRAHPRCRRPAAAAFHGDRWEVGVPYLTSRHGDQRPRFTRNRHPRHQVTPPWGALRAGSMRYPG